MAVPPGKAPILESVVAAVRLWRASLPRIWATAVLGGVLFTLAQMGAAFLGRESSLLAPLLLVLMAVIWSVIYGSFLHPPLDIAADGRRRLRDGMRVFSAMSMIGFFLLLLFFVWAMAASMLLAAVMEPGDVAQLETAAGDPAATRATAERLITRHPRLILCLIVLFGAAWIALTSRFYLAAPATVADQRVRTFETWAWTRDNMLRIAAARLLLLLPTWIVISLLEAAIGSAFGVQPLDPLSGASLLARSPAMAFLYLACAQILFFLIFGGLEAALSSYLYKGMKPVSEGNKAAGQ